MADNEGVSGVAIAAVFVGGILAWSGIKGYKISFVVQDFLSGKDPSTDPRVSTSQLSVSPSGLFGSLFGGLLSSLNPFSVVTTAAVKSAGGSASAGSNSANQALGQRMAAAVGWSGAQWTALNNLIMGESGWSSTVKNPTSSASGIAQNIQGFGPGYQYGNAAQQIQWLISYIKGRYGNPVNAYNAWLSRSPHWY